MNSLVSQSLQLVSDEIAVTLSDARLALEQYAEGGRGVQSLEKYAALLHTAKGVLRLTETYGASLLAEEMESTCRHLVKTRKNDGAGEALEALTRATVQLPAYVERILDGARDIPLVLLPLLNDLRAARGKPLLSESTLLLLNLVSPSEDRPDPSQRKPSGEDLVVICRELRPRFQLALLGWIKGERQEHNLTQIRDIAGRLEAAAQAEEIHQLWWVVGGVVEALLDKGLETSVYLKRLLGQADRELKRMQTEEVGHYLRNPPTELINNLLYYIARSATTGPRVTAIRAAFNLSDLMPADAQIEKVRQSLAAPSVRLMNTVAAAIRDDLAHVKDVLDIYVRTGMEHVEELAPQIELLKKIGDTLGVLGLGKLRETVLQKKDELQEILDQTRSADEATLVNMAAALLNVEDSLDAELKRLIVVPEEPAGSEADDADAAEFQKVVAVVMRECIVNLARVKDAVSQAIERNGEIAALDSVPQLLQGISAALLLLGKERAIEVVNGISAATDRLTRSAVLAHAPKQLDRLADAMVSLEYYMETLQAGRKEPGYMLDDARRCLAALAEETSDVADEIPEIPADMAETVQITVSQEEAEAVVAELETSVPMISSAGEKIDPELLELYIDEARQEIESIREHLPEWQEDIANEKALSTIRRSIHTLKGSGRMVGAMLMGDYCWSIEQLLNKLINKTLDAATPGIPEFIGRAVDVLPELLEQLEIGTAPSADLQSLMEEASRLSSGDPDAIHEVIEAPATQEPEQEPDKEDTIAATIAAEDSAEPLEELLEESRQVDPVLLDILSKEVHTHLEVLQQFVDDCSRARPPFPVPEELYRSCHTLHGSVTMAGVEAAALISSPLNRMVRLAFDNGIAVPQKAVSACATSATAIEAILCCLRDDRQDFPDTGELQTGLQVLIDEIEEEAALVIEDPDAGELTGHQLDTRIDPEIAAIFCEEAAEILETVDTSLARLAAGQDIERVLAELQRHLHTLKGGARMAGLSVMGDLSHDLETLLVQLQGGRFQKDGGMHELLQASVDALHSMREQALSGYQEAAPRQLLDRLRDVLVDSSEQPEQQPEQQPEAQEAIPGPASETVAAETADADALVPELSPELSPELPPELPPELSPELSPEPPETVEAAPDDQADVAEPESADEPDAGEQEPPPPELPAADKVGQLAQELSEPPRPLAESPAARLDLPAGAAALPGASPAQPRPEAAAVERREVARVESGLLEMLLNNAGEISIFHSRLGQQMNLIQFNLEELGQTVIRLRDQLRKLEMATEAQILYRHQSEIAQDGEFDPLELEQYSSIQQLSRALAETASDVSSLKDLLQNLTGDTDALLVQQARTAAELQDGLMRTRMVPFHQHAARLARLVRKTAAEYGKKAELTTEGSGELDRQVLEKMLPPFEHLLRNAVIHGIELPEEREAAGKPPVGNITVTLHREGSEVVVTITDDGAGIDIAAIREKALQLGIVDPDSELTDEQLMQLILHAGMSTADKLTQSAGRGIGMDVVASEVAGLGGTLHISSKPGEGSSFVIRLPFTLAVTQALIVRASSETYALPLSTVEGIIRIPRSEFDERISRAEPSIDYGDQTYRFRHLGQYLGLGPSRLPDDQDRVSIILVRAGANSTALITDEMMESREIVVKPVGPQFAGIQGVSGATILGDGRIVVILDVGSLVRTAVSADVSEQPVVVPETRPAVAMVVDDSITMRRVSQRLLERDGFRVLTAKDGIEAIGVMRDQRPDIILLDIEMPRMDGYEFAGHVRNDPETADIPIVMITSRVSDKHRARAIEIGVNDFLGKPYQEHELLEAIHHLLSPDQPMDQ